MLCLVSESRWWLELSGALGVSQEIRQRLTHSPFLYRGLHLIERSLEGPMKEQALRYGIIMCEN